MSELEDIRRKKMEELQQRYLQDASEQAQQEAQMQQQISQVEAVVKQRLTKEALQRYSNIKAADPDKATQLLLLMAQFLQAGRASTITDDMLKQILMKTAPKKREMKIRRV
ncbi:hypothetical protein COV19_03070 [Candidatus Woesearchaeota archaeon CG10_big_fil_rev_8_21_14_0_10_44_13]|nr:MAG: hypothetical protein COV19_03070 [Candidatus Woesearchaeota archaeon CG10_big_fil_rev_8_21_14_0_10_44_13]